MNPPVLGAGGGGEGPGRGTRSLGDGGRGRLLKILRTGCLYLLSAVECCWTEVGHYGSRRLYARLCRRGGTVSPVGPVALW